jgi:hypothetical protein
MGLVHFLPWFFTFACNRRHHWYVGFSEADSGYSFQRICCALVPQLGLSQPSFYLMALSPLRQALHQQRELGLVYEEMCSLRTTKVFGPPAPN